MPFTQNPTPTFAKQPRKALVQIANADASNNKSLIAAGSNGNKVMALYASSTDTSGRDIQVKITRSATDYVQWTTTVAASSGFAAGTPPVDLLSACPTNMLAVDHDGQRYFTLESGDTLNVASLTTVTSAKIVSVMADHEEF